MGVAVGLLPTDVVSNVGESVALDDVNITDNDDIFVGIALGNVDMAGIDVTLGGNIMVGNVSVNILDDGSSCVGGTLGCVSVGSGVMVTDDGDTIVDDGDTIV